MTEGTECHIREFTMDNSGQEPLNIPGFSETSQFCELPRNPRPLKIPRFGDISLFSELPKNSRFLQGSDNWEDAWVQKPV